MKGDATAFAVFDSDVVFEDDFLPDHVGETYRGQEGLLRALDRWLEVWEELTIDLDEIIGSGDRLVSVHTSRGKMRHTGIEFVSPLAYAWTLRGERVVHLKSFLSKQEALEAVGLRE